MKYKNIHLKFHILFILFIVFKLTNVAQINDKSPKAIWDNPQIADSLRFKALNEFYVNNTHYQPDSVLKLTDLHYKLAQNAKNKNELINALSEKSYAYFIKDNINKAEENLNEAIKIQTTLNDSVALARLYTNLASIYRAQSKFLETIQSYNYSLKIFEDNKQETYEAAVLGNLGLIYYDLKYNDIALDYLEKALALYKKLKLQDKVGYISLNIGAVEFDKGNYKEAINLAEKALRIFEQNNNLYSSLDCDALLAKSYQKLNKKDKAFFQINKAIELSQKLENTSRIIQNKIILAELYLDSDTKKATQIGEEILAMLDSNTDKQTKASLYSLLSNCYKKSNKIELSHKMYDNYIVYNDSIVKELSNLELVKESVNQEFKIKLSKNKLSFEQSEKDLKRSQLIKLILIILASLILIFSIYFYSRKKVIYNKKKNEELLEEIRNLKSSNTPFLVSNSDEFQLEREKIEASINRKLNETDWKVLNILLKEPDISNKEIAEKAFLSVDGIGSSLRRMYLYFEIKESKYKKTSLIMEAIKASKS